MLRLPIHSIHQENGAFFASYGRWELPEHYGNPLKEYRAIRERAGLADLSYQGKLLLSGPERISFLQKIASNDLALLSKESGIYSTLLTPKGKVLSDFYLFPLPNALLLETGSAIEEKTKTHLMRYRMRSQVKIASPPWGKLLVSGPSARTVIEKYIGDTLPTMKELSFFEKEIRGLSLICIKRSITGEGDYHIYCPIEDLDGLWKGIDKAGGPQGILPIGQETLEILRVESGIPRYGIDMDELVLPEEAGIHSEAVSYTKGCYPGQEVMARIKTYGHVNRQLSGLILDDDPLPKKDDPIFEDEKKVGRITSVVQSPFLNKGIAMGYLLSKVAVPGTLVTVETDEGRRKAEVTPLPFYPKKG